MTEVFHNGRNERDIPWQELLADGRIPGATLVKKYGQVKGDTTTGVRSVWEYGSDDLGDVDYIFPADGTAPIDTISSSDDSDVGTISIPDGLDINGDLAPQTVTLTGQTPVTLTTPLWRCHRQLSITADSDPTLGSDGFAGKIYTYNAGDAVTNGVPNNATDVKCFINGAQNQTLQSFYTVPNNCVCYLFWARSALAKKGTSSAIMEAWVRPYGLEWRLGDIGSLNSAATSVFQESSSLYESFPGRTDIMVRANVDTLNAVVTARFDIIQKDLAYL